MSSVLSDTFCLVLLQVKVSSHACWNIMDFETRSRRAYDRGDPVGALLSLVDGLKRTPDQTSALELMLALYAKHAHTSGLEQDVIQILQARQDGAVQLTRLSVMLETHGRKKLMDTLLARALASGLIPAPVEDAYDLPTDPHAILGTGVFANVDVLGPEDASDTMDQTMDTFDAPWRDEDTPDILRAPRKAVVTFDEERGPQAQEPVASPHDSTSSHDESSSEPVAPKFMRKRVLLVTTAVLLGAGLLWLWVGSRADLADLDAQMQRFDPAQAVAFERSLNQTAQRWGVDAREAQSRQSFVRSLMRLDHQIGAPSEPSGANTQDESHPWGMAASTLLDIQNGQHERALARATRMTHQWPGSLATLWTNARLEQARGKHEQARQTYARLGELYPSFIYGAIAQVKLAAYQGDPALWAQARDRLSQMEPAHPVAQLDPLGVNTPQMYWRVDGRKSQTWDGPQSPGFVEAYSTHLKAQEAWQRNDLARAKEYNTRALTLAPRWVLPQLMQASLQTLDPKADTASAFALAERKDLSVVARLQVMSVLNWMLIESNRHLDALTLTIVLPEDSAQKPWLEGLTEAERTAYKGKRPVPLALSAEQWRAHPEAAQAAIIARAHVLLQAGYPQHAMTTIEFLRQEQLLNDHARQLRAQASAQLGESTWFASALKSVQTKPWQHVVRAQVHASKGEHEQVLEVFAQQGHPQTFHGLRLLVRAHNARGEHEKAAALLERGPWSLSSTWSRKSLSYLSTLRAPPEGELTHTDQMVDVALASMRAEQAQRARELALRVIKRAPAHPDANRIMGLVLRQGRQYAKASRHIRLANGSQRAVGKGRHHEAAVAMELGRHKRARDLYYKAFLADRRDTQALAGLARAYMAFDPIRGKHELTRFHEGLAAKSTLRAQAGEVSKWLAVLHGSRKGSSEALALLKRAKRELGARADVLVEYGLYWSASKKWGKARDAYVQALQADSTSAQAHLGLARMSLKLDDKNTARTHLRRYLRLAPFGDESDWARESLLRVKSL